MNPLPWFVASLAIAPAVYAWWSGRAIQRSIDDPALPELLLDRQKRLVMVTLVAIIASVFMSAPTGFSILVLLLAIAANYPVRRRVYGDRWSLWQYVRFTTFSTIAFIGLWLYPLIVSSLAVQLARAWISTPSMRQTLLGLGLGVVAAIVYLIWLRYFTPVWLSLHQASPLGGERASLLPRFEAVLERARVDRRPTVHRYGASGGQIVNAAALCSLQSRAVAMSDALLDQLDDDEATAIFAHEIAHHEHFSDAVLRRRRWWSLLLAVLIVVVPPLQLAIGPRYALLVDLAVLFAVLMLFARGQTAHQAHETDCDRRAVDLTGNAEAVIRGLTKIHALSRMPRRFSQEFERAATHPSLARRIQAIRAHAALAEEVPDAPTVVASTTPGAFVAFDAGRVYWFEGVPENTPPELASLREAATSIRALAYSELGELRLVTEKPRMLRATDLAGRSWSVAIRDDDNSRVQAALDHVDVKLGRAPFESQTTSRNTARTLASVLLLATMMAGLWGVTLIVAAIGVLSPSAAALAAMAGLTLGHAAIAFATEELHFSYVTLALGVSVPLALWCAWMAWKWVRMGRDRDSRSMKNWSRAVFAVLWLGLVVSTATLAFGGLPSTEELVGDAQVARSSVTLLGLGAALLTLGSRAVLAGVLATVCGVAGIAVGAVGERWSSPASSIAWTTGRLSLVATVPVGRNVHEVEVSPGGTRFLTRRYVGDDGGDEEDYSTQLVTGRIPLDRPTRTLTAIDAAMPNESELLVLDRMDDDSLELRLERHDADSTSRVVWRDTLPAISEPRIQLDVPHGRWIVSGRLTERRLRRFVTIGGAMDGTDVQRIEVPADTLYGSPVHAYRDGATLVVRQAPRSDLLAPQPRSVVRTYLMALRGDMISWTLSRYERDGSHALARLRGFPTCASTPNDDVAACVEQRRRGTHLWSVARQGAVVDLGKLSSRYERASATPNGHVVASTYTGRSLAIIDVARRRGVRTSLPSGDYSHLSEASATDARVVAVLVGEQGARIAVYRLDAARSPALVAR
jgi:Zn-dependent protease with chaperone function